MPELKLSVPPLAAVYVPGQLEPQFPPPARVNVPLAPETVPELWNAAVTVEMLDPEVFSKMPELLTAAAGPPPNTRLLSLAKFQIPLERIFRTAPFSILKLPFPPDQFAVPPRLKVRFERTTLAAGKLTPASALIVAFEPTTQDVPLSPEQMNPPVHVRGVFKLMTPGAHDWTTLHKQAGIEVDHARSARRVAA